MFSEFVDDLVELTQHNVGETSLDCVVTVECYSALRHTALLVYLEILKVSRCPEKRARE